MKTVRVRVAAGDGVEDARRAVEDVLELLNRHFRPRGVEFVGAAEGGDDWTIALYWKDFGEMGREEFETDYERFKKEKKPIIHVFFKEPDEGIGEALKAFKEAFAERYGHFYCHFETVDAVRFQLAAQSLSMLPGGAGERDALAVEDGEVWLGKEPVAKMENLPFAKLNKHRQRLAQKLCEAERDVAGLEKEALENPHDRELADDLRNARVKWSEAREALSSCDQNLFDRAIYFARQSAEEMDERILRARELFDQGRVAEAAEILDAGQIMESYGEATAALVKAREQLDHEQIAVGRKTVQSLVASAEMAQANMEWDEQERIRRACAAYDDAIRVAKECHLPEEEMAEILFDYAKP